jgi:hypothetical protein
VWNDQDFTWKESFKGEPLEIPAGKYVELGFYEAVEFRGQMIPLLDDGNGGIHQKSQKKIRLVEHEWAEQQKKDAADDEPMFYPCNLCKEEFSTTAELIKHSVKKHSDRIVTDDDAEQEAPKKVGRPRKEHQVTT